MFPYYNDKNNNKTIDNKYNQNEYNNKKSFVPCYYGLITKVGGKGRGFK